MDLEIFFPITRVVVVPAYQLLVLIDSCILKKKKKGNMSYFWQEISKILEPFLCSTEVKLGNVCDF